MNAGTDIISCNIPSPRTTFPPGLKSEFIMTTSNLRKPTQTNDHKLTSTKDLTKDDEALLHEAIKDFKKNGSF